MNKVLFLVVLILSGCSTQPTLAQDDDQISLPTIMTASKLLGMCFVHNELILFHQKTKLAGGFEFASKFIASELLRLGWDRKQYQEACENAITIHNFYYDGLKDSES